MRTVRWGAPPLLAAGCIGSSEPEIVGPARCSRPATLTSATGCAFLFGAVTSTRGEALDGIEGSVRPGSGCGCQGVTLQVDERGLFSATVYRVPVSGGAPRPDSVQVTVVVQATAPRYPRHVTGAPYFDTVAVALRFAAIGAAPEPREVRLRIPLP